MWRPFLIDGGKIFLALVDNFAEWEAVVAKNDGDIEELLKATMSEPQSTDIPVFFIGSYFPKTLAEWANKSEINLKV